MIKQIHQIEITSQCNLACKYCVHTKMKRNKVDMDVDTYMQALAWAKHCVDNHGQWELNLCGIGESTMHPDFIEYLRLARHMLPNTVLVIASNGVKIDEEHFIAMAEYKVDYYVSAHRPEKAGLAIDLAKKYGILKGVSVDPTLSSINWAGQVDWPVSTNNNIPCPWLKHDMVMVTAEGDLVTCCLDGDGISKVGTVWDNINELNVSAYSLCKNCHHTVPKKGAFQLNKTPLDGMHHVL